MENNNNSVNLTKDQPWTDPATGEIYPGGNPNDVSQPVSQTMSQPVSQQPMSQPVSQQPMMQPVSQQPMSQPMMQQPMMSQPMVQQPMMSQPMVQQPMMQPAANTKFCKFCGSVIPSEAVICTSCGRQVEALQQGQTPIVINNTTTQNASPVITQNVGGGMMGREKNKWVAVILCFFFGAFGVHRFYEGKIGTGILWLFTVGLFGIGTLVDFIILLCKPNPYYVR